MTQHRQACVLEVNKEVIAVTDDGEFITLSLKGKPPEVGDIIDIPAAKKVKFKPILSFAAIAAVFLLMFLPYMSAAKAVMWVSLDVNPSIELGLDKEGKIVELQALNADAEKVLAHVNIEGQHVAEAIPLILAEMQQEKYITPQKENTVILSIATDKGYEELEERTSEKLKLVIDNVQEQKQIPVNKVYFSKANKEERKHAQEGKISFGKYVIYKKARAQGLKININDMNTMPAAAAVYKAGGKLSELLTEENLKSQSVFQKIYKKEKAKPLDLDKKGLNKEKHHKEKVKENQPGSDIKGKIPQNMLKEDRTKEVIIKKGSPKDRPLEDNVYKEKLGNKERLDNKEKLNNNEKYIDKAESHAQDKEKNKSINRNKDKNKDNDKDRDQNKDTLKRSTNNNNDFNTSKNTKD